MSDDDNVDYSFAKRKFAQRPEDDDKALEVMKELLRPDDVDGFLRVIEVLRMISGGDETTINVDSESIEIICKQIVASHASGELDDPSSITNYASSVHQAAFTFDFAPVGDAGSEEEYDKYIRQVASVAAMAIMSLLDFPESTTEEESE